MIKKIYFDLDCTLADFKKGIKEIGYDEKTQTDDEMWKMIKDTPHFYKHLKPIDGAVQMVNNLINKYGKEKIEILSGLPKEKRKIKTAKQDKIDWVKEFVSKDIIINLCTREEKKNYCKGKEYVLVDDLKENCEEWKENGGIAILCKSISKVDKEISKLINDDDISGLAFIKKYEAEKDKWLPLVSIYKDITDKRNEFGDYNIGWYAGELEANRPFYSECWATDGITMLTIYVSKIGIENIKVKDLLSKLVNIDYVKSKNGELDGKIGEFVDDNNNTFYVINITVGLPDEPALIDGGKIYPFSIKNEYINKNNTRRKRYKK